MKIIAYYRAKHDLTAQKRDVADYSAHHGADVIGEYTETTNKQEFPVLQEAIEAANSENSRLVIARLDRLVINVHFTSVLMESGVDFVACDNEHVTPLTIPVLVSVAENEARQISQRTKDSIADRRKRGHKFGSARPGHWAGREHIRKKAWKKAVKASSKARIERAQEAYSFLMPKIKDMKEEGLSYREIAEWINSRGHRTTRNKPFSGGMVHRILQRSLGQKPKKRKRLSQELKKRIRHMRNFEDLALWQIAEQLNKEKITTASGKKWDEAAVHYVVYGKKGRVKV